MCTNGRFCTSWIPKIDFTQDLRNRKITKFPHCELEIFEFLAKNYGIVSFQILILSSAATTPHPFPVPLISAHQILPMGFEVLKKCLAICIKLSIIFLGLILGEKIPKMTSFSSSYFISSFSLDSNELRLSSLTIIVFVKNIAWSSQCPEKYFFVKKIKKRNEKRQFWKIWTTHYAPETFKMWS